MIVKSLRYEGTSSDTLLPPIAVQVLNAQATSNARNQQMNRTSFHSTHSLFLMFTFILFRSIFSVFVFLVHT